MTTKKSKKDILWSLNQKLQDELTYARTYHHAALNARHKHDANTETYCEDERDAHRHAAFVLASIFREKQRFPDDILWRVRSCRFEETLNSL